MSSGEVHTSRNGNTYSAGFIGATPLGEHRRVTDKLVRTYPANRRCKCGWTLSIYNPLDECQRCCPSVGSADD